MKTAVSIPDDVFAQAEDLARKTGVSRSQLVSEALREYVARHASEQVTDAMNQVVDSLDEVKDGFASATARSALRRVQW